MPAVRADAARARLPVVPGEAAAGAAAVHALMAVLRLCGICRKPGHRRETCREQAPLQLAPVRASHIRAVRERGLEVAMGALTRESFNIAGESAEAILVRLRPLVRDCAAEPNMLDSLMLSCYLRGLLQGSGIR